MRKPIIFLNIILVLAAVTFCLYKWTNYTLLSFAAFLLIIGIHDLSQKKHTILRNFPIIGHLRFIFEMIAPEIHQYFVESDTDGKPIDRNHRDYVYQRAKLQNSNHPFGTELDINQNGFNWALHSIYPRKKLATPPRVKIGGPDCKQPYSSSLFNISAMSYGSLSKNAIMALNKGAKSGNFFHDTGEGGISPYHLQGGDLVYEIGTGYFGCRTKEGNFSAELFKKQAAREEVKMIEVKISQGAKPGHGGILPAAKNNVEIAKIRGVEPHTTICSPPQHSAFSNAHELLEFIQKLRDLSNGKPIGFKLSVGSKNEFEEICKEMIKTGIKPDFITVDGGEGGTGAAPIIFSNHVGMPWEKALVFVVDTLKEYGLKNDIKVITATKIFTSFNIFKALCIGADVCSTARGMMLALGCIQALRCHTNKCPTGVATNKKNLTRGLVIEEKWKRVRNYQQETVKEFLELLAASGCEKTEDLNRSLIQVNDGIEVKTFEEIYPSKTAI